ncbi:MAG: hypothetical protein KKB59_10620 [Spirochaetes bacterium]|nr:hypothetical protein [Spirochaetota bacterium]
MNLSGQRFGRLLVIEKTAEKYKTEYLYRCQCDCGGEKLASSSLLKSGVIRSCGCLQAESRLHDVTGQRFGRLVAIEATGRIEAGSMVWRWRCDCGNLIEARLKTVSSHCRVSCGCAAREQKKRQAIAAQEGCGRIDGTNISKLRAMTPASNNTSGRRGVSYHARVRKWQARIMFKGVSYNLGYYEQKEDAVSARERAESMMYEPFVEWYEAGQVVPGDGQSPRTAGV